VVVVVVIVDGTLLMASRAGYIWPVRSQPFSGESAAVRPGTVEIFVTT
jgi:hypothetical protein